ncbi:S1C family serine protease [Rubritalea tangerina]|uniref:S1C family serine protease n=1 Tax=Rubritalea tangerina TaxID=430798 RepID=A0ABW4ZA21_9BACT
MNKIFHFTSIAAIALAGGAHAIERITPIEEPQADKPKAKVEKKQAKAWLGVAGQPVDEALAAQLGVEHGVTLELVAPDGSAAQSGIQKYDIITKVGEKDIRGMADLRDVMRNAAVDSELELEIFSKGKKERKTVKLQARPQHLGQARVEPQEVKPRVKRFENLPQAFSQLPEADRKRIEEMMQHQARNLEEHFANMDIQMADIQELQKKMKGMHLDLGDLRMKGHSNFSGTFTMMDDQGSICMKMTDEKGKHVEVKDRQGKVLYAGPYDTEEDKAAVPADVRARIDAIGLDQQAGEGMGFQFHFGR